MKKDYDASPEGWYTAKITEVRAGKLPETLVVILKTRQGLLAVGTNVKKHSGAFVRLASLSKAKNAQSLLGKWVKVLVKKVEYDNFICYVPIAFKHINSREKAIRSSK